MSSGGNTITRHRDRTGAPSVALREGRPSSPTSPEGAGPADDNPFAPPPKDAPDRPWQPRHHGEGTGGTGDAPAGTGGTGEAGDSGQPSGGDRWSSNQPEPHRDGPGGFGGPGQGGGPGGFGTPGRGSGYGPRFDPSDPVQRHARYALLCGMWGLFFGLFSMPQVGLLLGVLAIYWGVSSLRAKETPAQSPREQVLAAFRSPATAPSAAEASYGPGQARPQFTAAVSGIITGIVALAVVAMTFSFQVAYKDYYSCVQDALTQPARVACNDMLPPQLRPMLGVRN